MALSVFREHASISLKYITFSHIDIPEEATLTCRLSTFYET